MSETFGMRLRRLYNLRGLGHNPFAPNCMWSEPDILHPRDTCESCARLVREYPSLRRVMG